MLLSVAPDPPPGGRADLNDSGVQSRFEVQLQEKHRANLMEPFDVCWLS